MSVAVPEWLERHRVSVVGLSLDDVIGLRAAKREVRSLVARLNHPEVMLAAGGDLPRGILFWGAPGCGKTLLARAMAATLATNGANVDFYSIAASDVDAPRFEELAAWLGSRAADDPLAVLYIDEIDLWARDRDDYRHTDSTRATLLGALAAIDGLNAPASRNRVLWLASSNRHPRLLDAALVRAGRFGFKVSVGWPTLVERAEILRFYAATRRVAADIDWRRAAALAGVKTSPAQLRQALDDALALALADLGTDAVVSWRHVAEAMLRRGRVDDEPLPSAERRWEVAVHEAGHAVASIVRGVAVSALTIRKNDSGTTDLEDESEEPRDSMPFGATALAARATISMAGLAAERIVLGRYGIGGASDVANATRTALLLIDEGATEHARPLKFDDFEQSPMGQDERYLAAATIVAAARREAESIVLANRRAIEVIAQALMARTHLSGAELAVAVERAGLRMPEDELDVVAPEIDELERELAAAFEAAGLRTPGDRADVHAAAQERGERPESPGSPASRELLATT